MVVGGGGGGLGGGDDDELFKILDLVALFPQLKKDPISTGMEEEDANIHKWGKYRFS